jgi:hypothetical protein
MAQSSVNATDVKNNSGGKAPQSKNERLYLECGALPPLLLFSLVK